MAQETKQQCQEGKEEKREGVPPSFAAGFVVLACPHILPTSSHPHHSWRGLLFLVHLRCAQQSRSSLSCQHLDEGCRTELPPKDGLRVGCRDVFPFQWPLVKP